MQPIKKWYQSKTVWVGLLTLVVAVISFLVNEAWIRDYPQLVAILGTVIGVLTIVLRFLTDTVIDGSQGVRDWKRNRKK